MRSLRAAYSGEPFKVWGDGNASLRRLGNGSAHLLDYYIKILVHINPKLDRSNVPIKLEADFLV